MTRCPDTNSGTRYFYTDPLAAAWMTAHHGMKIYIPKHRWFKGKEWTDFTIGIVGLCHEVVEEDRCNGRHERYYIHPDSLRLLEPQVGDMVAHFGLRAWRIDSMDDLAYFHPNMPNEGIGRFTLKADKPDVIARNGKPFHWPESEAV